MIKPLWHDNPDIARRIAFPTPYPGGPVAVAGATVSKRQRQADVQAGLAAVDGKALASNSLAELRDAISCPVDKLAAGLRSVNPAGYFFLGGTFYDDTRAAAASECSQPVRQWADKGLFDTAGNPGCEKFVLAEYNSWSN
eukprot:gene1254-1594_t